MNKLGFLVSLTTSDNDYQIEQAKSAEEAARKHGVEIGIIYADNDAIQQDLKDHLQEAYGPFSIATPITSLSFAKPRPLPSL